MLSLHTNTAALSAQNSISRTQQSLSTSMTRLGTGFRINSAMDDAAGLQIATRLKAQTSGMAKAMENTQNSTSLLQTAEGAFSEVSNMLVRMKDLATQAADASSSTADKTAIQSEYDALGQELYNVVTNTRFGGSLLLGDGAAAASGTLSTSMTFQIGAGASEKMTFDASATLASLKTTLFAASANYAAAAVAGGEVSSGTSANAAIGALTTAISSVGALQSSIGAVANRLDHINTNLMNISTNTKAATGRIMDVDFATESSKMTSSQMLLQAGTAMLKQSNSMSSMVMSLLQ
ncbi:flagellin [Janthinobacterium fluminis]|uniref:Flagellin n=1 Tax=Janthinobacterium fluminis TaxID=2987524 RepID=A0ABT5JUT8_9BURK|nr:flagellin [Janthinobacterium fluminis]MDC8756511.1 flagellin [Janthinobacterium fluminis]